MEVELALKIRSDEKLHNYLIMHSSWYRLLNRDSSNYDKLVAEYKKNKRDENFNKFNEAVDNIDLITNVIKMV